MEENLDKILLKLWKGYDYRIGESFPEIKIVISQFKNAVEECEKKKSVVTAETELTFWKMKCNQE